MERQRCHLQKFLASYPGEWDQEWWGSRGRPAIFQMFDKIERDASPLVHLHWAWDQVKGSAIRADTSLGMSACGKIGIPAKTNLTEDVTKVTCRRCRQIARDTEGG